MNRAPRRISHRLVLLAAMILGPATAARAEEDDFKRMQGSWECIETIHEGQPVKDYVGVRATIDDNRLTFFFLKTDGNRVAMLTKFRLDPSKDPKVLEFTPDNKPQDVHSRLYKFEGEQMKWSTNLGTAPRPATFDEGKWQFTLKRIENYP